MAEMSEARKLAEQRAMTNDQVLENLDGTNLAATRPLDVENISKGDKDRLPVDYHLYSRTIDSGENVNKAYYTILESGKIWWLNGLFRGARPAVGGDRVKPKGSVVMRAQKLAKTTDLLDELRGEEIWFENVERVVARGFNGTGTSEVNVWTISSPKYTADGELAA